MGGVNKTSPPWLDSQLQNRGGEGYYFVRARIAHFGLALAPDW